MISIPKLLIIILVIAAIYYLFFRKPKAQTGENCHKKDQDNSRKKIDEIMVECAKCGTFVSPKEAIIKDGQYFCSKECAA